MIPRYRVEYGFLDAVAGLANILGSSQPAPVLPGFEQHDLFFTRRGRDALFLILSSLGIRKGAKIGVPLYVCSVVSKAIVAAGMKPVFLDMDPATYGVSVSDLAQKANGLDALILVHLFGYPAPMDDVIRIMGGKPIIEDCAHSLGSSYHGKPLGSVANTAFFSFGFFKPMGVGGGGCIVTRDPDLASGLHSRLDGSPGESRTRELAHLFQTALYGTAYQAPFYTLLRRFRPESGDPEESLARYPPSVRIWRSDAGILARRLRGRKRSFNFADQISQQEFGGLGIPPEPEYGSWNHFTLPLTALSKDECSDFVAYLRHMGVGASQLYPSAVRVARELGYGGGCPQAEDMEGRVFMVPSYSELGSRDRARVLRAIRVIAMRADSGLKSVVVC